MTRLRIAITTLGCKVNRADGDALVSRMGDRVQEVHFSEEADLYIVNSCTVTASADRQSRQMMYRARRRNPLAKVVLTGCLAAMDRGTDHSADFPLAAADRIFPLCAHDELIRYVLALQRTIEHDQTPLHCPIARMNIAPRERPFLKIQDGCNGSCTYCVVPRVRGPSRSVPVQTVESELRRLADEGCNEVVLTGIHLGAYGADLAPPITLADLLRRNLGVVSRLRLSSLEPLEISPALIELMRSTREVCPHLHIPLQSGDDAILAAMNRPYRRAYIDALLAELRRTMPRAALGTDLITGFPGETEGAFARSLELVENSPLSHFHIFHYSLRPGTPAAAMVDQVSEATSRARTLALRRAGQRKTAKFTAAQVGTVRAVLVERQHEEDGLLSGLTENYLRVLLRGDADFIGKLVNVRIERANGVQLFGSIV
jgi:threonylcarbamoyladenosine tRNA methylthiotransferase MtaB